MRNAVMTMFLGLGIVTAGVLPVQADIVLDEDFTGVTAGTFNENGWFFGCNTGGTVWQMSTYSTAPMSGDVLRNQSGHANNTKAYTQFPSFVLTKDGDYIKVALNYRSQSTAAGTFAVSLLGFGATITSNNLVNGKMIPDAGHGYGTSHTLSTTPVAQKYGKYTNDGWPTTATLYTNSQTLATDTNPHSYTLTLTKVATGVRLGSTTDATVFDSYIDTTSPYTSFDTVRLFANQFTSGFLIDNITVETYVMPPKGTTVIIR